MGMADRVGHFTRAVVGRAGDHGAEVVEAGADRGPDPAGHLPDRRPCRAVGPVDRLHRVAGEAAEIEDHINRGRNMDTRTPASQCRFGFLI